MKPATLHKRACRLLGVDPAKARLLGPTEWKAVTGSGVGKSYGRADWEQNVVYVRRTAGYDTHVHELLHLLFPSRPHWWIFSAAFKLSGLVHGNKGPGAWYIYGRLMRASDAEESRTKILRLAHAAAKRKGLAPHQPR